MTKKLKPRIASYDKEVWLQYVAHRMATIEIVMGETTSPAIACGRIYELTALVDLINTPEKEDKEL